MVLNMTTKELVNWVLSAEAYHEENWEDKHLMHPRAYIKDCLLKTKSITDTTEADLQLAMFLMVDYWNDCQDLESQFDQFI